jgi:nitrate reductase cytochrome c-type subunit
MKQEHGYWRISSERIQSYEHQSPSMCSPSRYACLGATCHVDRRRQ